MDTPVQRVVLAWTIFAIGMLALITAAHVFRWRWWMGALGAVVLGGALGAAGLWLIPIGTR